MNGTAVTARPTRSKTKHVVVATPAPACASCGGREGAHDDDCVAAVESAAPVGPGSALQTPAAVDAVAESTIGAPAESTPSVAEVTAAIGEAFGVGVAAVETTVDGRSARVVLNGTAAQPALPDFTVPPRLLLTNDQALRAIVEAEDNIAACELALKPYADALKEAKRAHDAAVSAAVQTYRERRQMRLGEDE
jgi:hypothetical protein